MCAEVAELIRSEFPNRSLSGIGGIETGHDAAQFILLGCSSIQLCTSVMKYGYGCIQPMCEQLEMFMEQHAFQRIADFTGYSLPFLTGHTDLVRLQQQARPRVAKEELVTDDEQWNGDTFVDQSERLASG
jgi:dihydropyrimidine dehydrogenase (NADP+)/dihydropyrimidine dehydrogenase (NAD+) subunit PreA